MFCKPLASNDIMLYDLKKPEYDIGKNTVKATVKVVLKSYKSYQDGYYICSILWQFTVVVKHYICIILFISCIACVYAQ